MEITQAILTIAATSPMTQSHQHNVDKLEGESADAYDLRTWRSKLNVIDDEVVIPAHGLHQCIAAAAKYSKRQIAGQGKATWTKKFESGISANGIVSLGISPNDEKKIKMITISANADGIRGSGKRVTRRFPMIVSWQATTTILILDPIITRDIFKEMADLAGVFIGLGQFRPQNGGTNGRFDVVSLEWHDNRRGEREKKLAQSS